MDGESGYLKMWAVYQKQEKEGGFSGQAVKENAGGETPAEAFWINSLRLRGSAVALPSRDVTSDCLVLQTAWPLC
jgi:hypothetical protein